ncbi:polysaccharide deacetylase family protein [Streptococcus entericus]|uniref:polysaccharide deacetylase family protein n=1 Tax=Streptococcus entericus TaxID=155680 RepID=UPI00037C68C7|nr:polysaccharide deacetylase family protein [Streptococcus entericus]
MKFSRLQLSLITLNLIGVIAISYLLVTRQQSLPALFKQAVVNSRTSADLPSSSSEISTEPISSSEGTETSASSSEAPTVSDPTQLMPQHNHNYAANDYAYDIKDIQAYLKGDKPYDGQPLVFITIDDGANHDITPRVLDLLKEHQVHATFFPIGSEVTPDKAKLYRRQINEGHAIGLHSYSHDLDLLYPGRVPNVDQIAFEAKQADKALKRVLGMKFQTHVWRYPGGALSWQGLDAAHSRLADLGLTWLDWNASLGDAEPTYRRPQTVDEMIAFHAKSLEKYPQSPQQLKVVLLHDAPDKTLTLETLPHIIQYYKDNGYTFGVLH